MEKKDVQFGVRLNKQLLDDIDRLAAEDRRARSNYIVNVLEDKVREEKLKADKAS